MKTAACVAGFFSALLPVLATARDFYVEDETLAGLPAPVEKAIRETKDFNPACKLIGKPINLNGRNRSSGFAATTANACDWGAALGPIWVVANGRQPAVVLSYGGYTLTLRRRAQHSLRDIAISAGTTGHSSESLWKFDGAHYVKTREEARFPR